VGAFDRPANPSTVKQLAAYLTTTYPKTYFGERATMLDQHDWVNEGMRNASLEVYTTPEDQAPSQEYLATGKKLAEEEVTLAGYRLAQLLNQLLA
jgi:hypothetical protein